MTHIRFVLAALSAVVSTTLPAQTRMAEATASLDGVRTNASGAALDHVVAIDMSDVSIRDALSEIAALAKLRLVVEAPDDAVLNRTISFRELSTTLRSAAKVVLSGTGLHAEATGHGVMTIVPDQPSARGRVRGVVLDRSTKDAVVRATVSVVGTSLSTLTKLNGTFSIADVPSGPRTLAIKRLGYVPATRQVTVVSDSEVSVQIDVAASARVLDQVVTTATGPTRALETGNVLGTISDSIVGTVALPDFASMLNARVAGVQVFSSNGFSGAAPLVNIRGQNSYVQSNQPLLYVDGVRVDNSMSDYTGGGHFNDLVPEEIESIEVVKGPAASALYGTDAANGIILVKTKSGKAGARHWNFYGEGGDLRVNRDAFPLNYFAWGKTPGGQVTRCALMDIGSTGCHQDSITTFSPLRDPITTPIGTGNRGSYGAQVSGGGADATYLLSAAYEQELGVIKLPVADRAIYAPERASVGLSLTGEDLRPNAVERLALRSNFTASLGSTVDAAISLGYVTRDTRIPYPAVLSAGVGGLGYRDSTDGWQGGQRPAYSLLLRHNWITSHPTFGLTTTWRPAGWLTGHGDLGLDFANDQFTALTLAGEGPPGANSGSRTNQQQVAKQYTADLVGTAAFGGTSGLSSKTSVGVQYNKHYVAISQASASMLRPGGTLVTDGAIQSSFELSTETIVAGAFAEEVVGLNDRLFLTVSDRADGAGSFGKSYGVTQYPRLSGSWLVSAERFWPKQPILTGVRLRTAVGQSGVQPGPFDHLTTVSIAQAFVDGTSTTGASIAQLGNPNLRPERQREGEGGLDLDFFDGRLHLEGTYYDKHSSDALNTLSLPTSAGGYFEVINLGSVRNWGYESVISAEVLRGRTVDWTVSANGSTNHNQLLTLGRGYQPMFGSSGQSATVPGYPLASLFDYPITGFTDANHDGIIEPNEVQVGTKRVFMGQLYPKQQATAMSQMSLLNDLIEIRALFDYRGGFKLWNNAIVAQCAFGACPAAVLKNTPLAEQARVAAIFLPTPDFSGFYEDGSFTRFRELSVTFNVPQSIVRRLRMRTASVALSGRNLMLWTKYTGVDPEVNSNQVGGEVGAFSGPYADFVGLPPVHYWLARVNLGF